MNTSIELRKPPYRVARARLSNGLRLVTIETPHLHTRQRSASTCGPARATRRRATNGLSHFVEHMLFRGSAQFPNSFALNLAIEELGGTLYAETGRDYSLYQIPLHPAELPRGLEILGDLFSTPAFRDIDLERQIIIEEILEDLDDDGRNVNVDDLSRAAGVGRAPAGFHDHRAAANVRRFKTDDVRAHFQHFYGAANMVLCVAGPLSHARGRRRWRARAFARVPRGRGGDRPRPPRVPPTGRASARCTTNRRRRRCRSCFTRCPRAIPTTWRCARWSRVLDDGMSTRLHYQICDQKGLAYSVVGQPRARTTTPRCSRSTPPARTRSCPRWSARRWRSSARFRDELGQRGRARQGQAPLPRRLEACYDDLDSLCGWFGGTELYARAAPQEQRARELDARAPRGHPRASARRVIRAERLSVVVVGALDRALARKVATIVREFR